MFHHIPKQLSANYNADFASNPYKDYYEKCIIPGSNEVRNIEFTNLTIIHCAHSSGVTISSMVVEINTERRIFERRSAYLGLGRRRPEGRQFPRRSGGEGSRGEGLRIGASPSPRSPTWEGTS
jgi:hypothetical protein